ncbi:universal stress protein [Micromonospora sp. WMMA1363]|uniref:universal stress protein n=1 Tax=Micromonospora sp. WMMA1363 TaxID=3053985 RepID=UPI00259D1D22|nr:universal stress protein [Micromonospora sp. WMMA1363]MDM4718219.1 universal stress protein [Micromonospora sp. WMMA1363]
MAVATDAPVLAGVGSRWSLPLVRLAAQEAAAHDRPLCLLHAFDWAAALAAPSVVGPHDAAEELLTRAEEVARDVDETLTINGEIAEGPVVEALIRRSGSAYLVVVGDGGMSTAPGWVSAETPTVQVAARAGCPVLVTRRGPPPEGPVLVGVDGSADSRQALAWAFGCAARRGARLVAVRVVEPDRADADPAVLAGIVARIGGRHPDVPVECHTVRGDPGTVLVEQSRSSQVSVVATRGDQPGRGMLGSVSQSVLYHSPAPVIVVRGLAATEAPDVRDQGP